MASTFKIFQEGKDELVTAYFPVTRLTAPRGYTDCGIYKLQISCSTPSGNKPSFEWAKYLSIDIFDGVDRQLLQTYVINTKENVISLYIRANIKDNDCQLDTTGFNNDFPDGKMLCDATVPSGAAATFDITLKSTDETKVIVDSSRGMFVYVVTG